MEDKPETPDSSTISIEIEIPDDKTEDHEFIKKAVYDALDVHGGFEGLAIDKKVEIYGKKQSSRP
jgi:hypothetical protein